MRRPAPGIETMLEAGAEHHAGIVAEDVFGPVAVMYVEINHGDALESVVFQRVGDADGHIVVKTKAHGLVPCRMVAGRAHVAEGVFHLTRQDEVGGEDEGASSAEGRFRSPLKSR